MKQKFTWTGEAREPRVFTFDRGNPAWEICYPIEQETGWGWLEVLKRIDDMSPTAWRALLWAVRKVDEPRLQIEYVELKWEELTELLYQCPGCNQWIVLTNHACDLSAVKTEVETEPEDAPKKQGKKKAGGVGPEA